MHNPEEICSKQFCLCPPHMQHIATHTHTHTRARARARLMALFPFNGPFSATTWWAGTRVIKPIWILLKQETVSSSGISWDICKSAPRSRQITTPAPHRSVFYRPDALPAAQPTLYIKNSKNHFQQ